MEPARAAKVGNQHTAGTNRFRRKRHVLHTIWSGNLADCEKRKTKFKAGDTVTMVVKAADGTRSRGEFTVESTYHDGTQQLYNLKAKNGSAHSGSVAESKLDFPH